MLKTLLRLIITLVILLLFIFLLINLGPYRILSIILGSNWVILMMILLTNFLAVVFFFLAWHSLLIKLEKISLYESFKSTCIAIFFNLIVPSFSLSGEYARIVYLNKNHNISNEKLLATLSINKFQYGLAMSLFLIIGLILMFFSNLEISVLLSSLYIVFILITLLLLFILLPNFSKKIIRFILKKLVKNDEKIRQKYDYLVKKSEKFIDDFSYFGRYLLKSPSSMIALIFMIIQWFFNSLSFYLAFLAVGYPANLGILIFTFPIVALLTTSAVLLPANIGVVEPIMIGIYSGFGINPIISAAAILIGRTIIILEDLLLTFPFAIGFGLKIKLF